MQDIDFTDATKNLTSPISFSNKVRLFLKTFFEKKNRAVLFQFWGSECNGKITLRKNLNIIFVRGLLRDIKFITFSDELKLKLKKIIISTSTSF